MGTEYCFMDRWGGGMKLENNCLWSLKSRKRWIASVPNINRMFAQATVRLSSITLEIAKHFYNVDMKKEELVLQ